MAADRDRPTTADYVITAISPVLVMLMVGSLVFFLVEVLYAGQYSFRLLYTMFFFVMGAVLVARIAIQYDGGRASVYGLGLAVVVYLAMTAYVDYPRGSPLRSYAWAVNIGLMAVVWWSAHRLTWDCTHLDTQREASGRGVLSAAGLDADAAGEPAAEAPRKRRKRDRGYGAWFARFLDHREKQRAKPHTPGVWVVYFGLAALPLFGLGQSLIDAADAGRRHTTFLLMTVYVGSALGLLVTTSLIGLRKYLRQKRAKVPTAVTANWLGLGAGLILLFLVIGAFLPRPHSEVAWFGLARVGSTDHKASRNAPVKQGQGDGKGATGEASPKREGTRPGEKGSQADKGNGSEKSKDGGRGKSSRSEKSGGDGEGKEGDGTGSGEGEDAQSTSDSPNPSDSAGGVLAKVGGFLKWLVFGLVLLAVLAAVGYFVLRYLAPFTGWARDLLEKLRHWWANLFARSQRQTESAGAEPLVTPEVRLPFAAFVNPFADGTAKQRTAEDLVAYTFAALDAWAGDRGEERLPTETPLEFVERLGSEFPALDKVGQRLGLLYVRTAYSRGSVGTANARTLEDVWDRLEEAAPRRAIAVE